MRIGIDGLDGGALGIPGDPELCLMAIGVGQPIGNVVMRDAQTGMFSSLTRLMGFGRRAVGRYLDVEPVEIEARPNPRRAPARAARLVLAVALVVVAATRPEAGLGAAALLAGAALGRWAAEYARREFGRQWRLAAFVLAPALAFLAWAWWWA
jgi:hypothetical protein